MLLCSRLLEIHKPEQLLPVADLLVIEVAKARQ
jgi:hypothetical protein